MQVNHKATTRVQKAFKLEHVPVEKVSTMVHTGDA